ncbi:MAG: PASTA domain-containing protein [Oscillospiraceae bacterium]|nr:PASTA domain-containing protein [Oscillospiraceae bacterium]
MLTEERYLCMGCMSVLDENGNCRCGYDEDAPTDEACIPVRTVVGERYIIGRMTKMNGEAITYIGFDKENEEKVFIHEYMPQKIAKRNELTGEVVPFPGCETQYKTLMADFFDLFDALRNFRHTEYMMPVTNVIRDNNTVYAVYKYIKTISYGDYLSHNGGEFTWPQVKRLFMPLFTTLTYLHSNGFVHRGISPESIRVNAKGQLMLCGFGTAALYSKDSIVEPNLSAGYSAPEQYSAGYWQGEWTDVYSVAAVLYKSLTGTLPVDAESRKEADNLCPPEELNINISSSVSDAILNAMTVSSEYRTRSIDDFTAELLESAGSNTKLFGVTEEAEIKKAEEEYFPQEKERRQKKEKKKVRIPWGFVVFIIMLAVLLGIVAFLFRYTEVLGFGNRSNLDNSDSSSQSSSYEEDNQSGYLITVPNFVGRMRNNVESNEDYSKFSLVFEEENNNDYVEGMIFDQSVKYRTEVEEGTTIVLKVSIGPEKVPMPDLIGSTLEEATALLAEMGISFQLVPNYSAEYEYNIVYDQSVPKDTEVAVSDRMSKVYIYYGALESSGNDPWGGSSGDSSSNPGVTVITPGG